MPCSPRPPAAQRRLNLARGVGAVPPAGALDPSLRCGGDLRLRPGELAKGSLLGSFGADKRLVVIALDERLNAIERDVVVDLLRRALHEVARRSHEGALEPAIQAQLQTADRIGDDAGAVGAVPDLELELGIEGHVTEGRALHPDVAPLSVEQPRHVVARADVDVVRIHLVIEHGRDRVRLADLLGLEALALEHVQEVRVAAEVQLVGPIKAYAAIHEQAGQHAVADRGADLALDVVTDDRQAGFRESALPVRLATDEDGNGIDERDAGAERLLDIPLGRLFAPDREVGNHDVDLALLEDPDDVGRRPGGLLDDLAEVLPEAVMGHPALDLDAHVRDLLKDERVVRLHIDRLRDVLADLVLVDIERRHELDVLDVVTAELDMHQARDEVAGLGVLVVVAALDQAAGAVTDADDGDADLAVPALRASPGSLGGPVLAVLAVAGAHCVLLTSRWARMGGGRRWTGGRRSWS